MLFFFWRMRGLGEALLVLTVWVVLVLVVEDMVM